jgi:hypothetical protein
MTDTTAKLMRMLEDCSRTQAELATALLELRRALQEPSAPTMHDAMRAATALAARRAEPYHYPEATLDDICEALRKAGPGTDVRLAARPRGYHFGIRIVPPMTLRPVMPAEVKVALTLGLQARSYGLGSVAVVDELLHRGDVFGERLYENWGAPDRGLGLRYRTKEFAGDTLSRAVTPALDLYLGTLEQAAAYQVSRDLEVEAAFARYAESLSK